MNSYLPMSAVWTGTIKDSLLSTVNLLDIVTDAVTNLVTVT